MAPPFGAGPPLRTPAFELELELFGKKYKFQLYFQAKPWTTWLNAIQVQANVATDLEILESFHDDNTPGAAIAENRTLAELALGEAFTGKPGAPQSNDALTALLDEVARTASPGTDLESLLSAVIDRRSGSGHVFIQDTHANAGLYPAAAYPDGSFRRETDRTVLFMALSGAWVYVAGIMREVLANKPTDLGANDSGFLFEATDYSHVLRWTGAAWGWGPADLGSGFYSMFEAAPSGYGSNAWQICDGSTVARLNSDGTTTNVALDNLGTAAYLKGGTSSAAVAAAGGTTAGIAVADHPDHRHEDITDDGAATLFTENLIGGKSARTGNQLTTGYAALTLSHVVTQGGPGSLELRNKQARLYFRR